MKLVAGYLGGAVALEVRALYWIRPTPTPPRAPASSPSMISIGIVSKRDFLIRAITAPYKFFLVSV
jgi:hypothetical protein